MYILETQISYRMEEGLDGGQIADRQKSLESVVVIQFRSDQGHRQHENGRERMGSGDTNGGVIMT